MQSKYKAFDNAEEVWFWFCNIIDNQAGGLRSRTNFPGVPRVCEIGDIYLILKKMHFQDNISNRHLRVLYRWGIIRFLHIMIVEPNVARSDYGRRRFVALMPDYTCKAYWNSAMQVGVENFFGISEAYVVFEDANSLWWLRFLKKGFRHCFILLISREHNLSIILNPRSNQIDVRLYHDCASDKMIKLFTDDSGCIIERVHLEQAPLKSAPIMAFTCVEFVKRVMGIHCFSIITPYQLYKKIKNSRKKVLTF